MPERFRGELLTMGRYTNPASFTWHFVTNLLFRRLRNTLIIIIIVVVVVVVVIGVMQQV